MAQVEKISVRFFWQKSNWLESTSSVLVKPRRPQSRRGFTRQPENSKRAHFRALAFKNTTKIQRKDPQESEERMKIVAGEGKKRAKFWAVRRKGIWSLSCCVLQCCPISIHLQCVTDLVHLPSQSVVCSACNSQSPSSLDFLHFQHLCCVRHVEAPAGECMICSSPESFASSFSLPCCRQRIHYECLARSVHACGDHCPFCTQDLVSVLSEPLLAASFEHLDIPIDFNAPPANSSLNSLCVPADMPHPPPIFSSVVTTVVALLISNN